MVKVMVECDRCHKCIEGIRVADELQTFTGGYYDVTGYWSQYANPGESIVCDACMHSDERYLADYPPSPTLPNQEA